MRPHHAKSNGTVTVGPISDVMGHSAPADIFILVHPRHFDCVERCVASMRKNIQPGGGKICIVTAALPGDLRRRLDGLGCTYLHEADVFGTDAAGIAGGNKVFAQFLKWELRRFSSTPTYLAVDAATVVPERTDTLIEDQPALFCENRFRFGWLMCFNYFFGQIPIPTAPASGEICHFDCAILDEMVGKIQGRWNASWMNAATAIVHQVAGTAFDAADAFAHYLHLFYPDRFLKADATLFRAIVRSSESEIAAMPASPPISPAEIGTGVSATEASVRIGVVRMGTLGYNGRFANQIFQYAFLRSYAEKHELRAECPPWIGSSLFGHQSILSQNTLPVYREDKGDADEMIRFDSDRRYDDFELWGYFQDPRHWAEDPERFRSLFTPLPFLKQPLDDAIGRLKKPGQTLVAIHLRRGDFNGGPVFWPAPEEWYLRWLAEIWHTLPDPILYVASDDPVNVLPRFAAYQPKTAADLGVTVNGAEYYSDFYVLSQCNVLGISNSSFSFSAAMLNRGAELFSRPDPSLEQLVSFDPWNSDVQLRKAEPLRLAA